MNTQFAAASYAEVHKHSSVQSASPHKLVDMLFEGALDRIVKAKGAMKYGNIELKGSTINATVAIIGGLRESLNKDQGGDLAENLDALYIYIQGLLTKAHVNNDAGLLDESAVLLGQIRSAWKEIG